MDLLPTPRPVVHYLRCRGAGRKPREYIGDWPVRGGVYACDIRPAFDTGEAHIYIHGFVACPPYACFKAWRFEHVAEVWLN